MTSLCSKIKSKPLTVANQIWRGWASPCPSASALGLAPSPTLPLSGCLSFPNLAEVSSDLRSPPELSLCLTAPLPWLPSVGCPPSSGLPWPPHWNEAPPPSRISPVLQHHPLKNSLVAPITFYTVTHLLVCHLSSPFGCKQHEGEPCVSCALTQCRPVSRPSEYLLNERMNCGFIFLSVFSALLVHKYIFTSHISKRCFNVRGWHRIVIC